MADFSNASGARENEEFADELNPNEGVERNWIVTIRFYSLLHYTEEILKREGYNSQSHDERENNILSCRKTDNTVYKAYRKLLDLSRDARYECLRMGQPELQESEDTLEDGKQALGFQTNGGSTKYST